MEIKSEKELSEIISRVMSEVNHEVKTYEPTFKISDFRDHANELSKIGDKAAWTISYSTSKSAVDKLGGLENPASKVAWTITYSTSRSAVDKLGGLENSGI